MTPAQGDHAAGEAQHVAAGFVETPVEPRDLIVLAVGIVVPTLGAGEFIPVGNHRHALGEEQGGHHVALRALSRGEDLRIVGEALG